MSPFICIEEVAFVCTMRQKVAIPAEYVTFTEVARSLTVKAYYA